MSTLHSLVVRFHVVCGALQAKISKKALVKSLNVNVACHSLRFRACSDCCLVTNASLVSTLAEKSV